MHSSSVRGGPAGAGAPGAAGATGVGAGAWAKAGPARRALRESRAVARAMKRGMTKVEKKSGATAENTNAGGKLLFSHSQSALRGKEVCSGLLARETARSAESC